MTEEDETRRGESDGPLAGPRGPEGPGPTGGPDDALRSLERLQSLAKDERASAAPKPASPSPHRRRPRLASAPRPVQAWARIAAPAAFLVAVIVVVSVAFQSGVVGGDDGKKGVKPAAKVTKTATKSPKPSASGTKSTTPTTTGDTRSYTVKPGDTMSGIAARFDTSVAEVERLNPDADLTTLQPGQKLIVPAR
jgi:LysM repeat protein